MSFPPPDKGAGLFPKSAEFLRGALKGSKHAIKSAAVGAQRVCFRRRKRGRKGVFSRCRKRGRKNQKRGAGACLSLAKSGRLPKPRLLPPIYLNAGGFSTLCSTGVGGFVELFQVLTLVSASTPGVRASPIPSGSKPMLSQPQRASAEIKSRASCRIVFMAQIKNPWADFVKKLDWALGLERKYVGL